MELQHKKSSMLSICIMLIHMLHLFELDSGDRREFLGPRTKSRKDPLVSQLSTHLSTPNAEATNYTNIARDVGGSSHKLYSGSRFVRLPFFVDVETPLESCKKSKVADLVRKGLSPIQPPTAGLPRRLTSSSRKQQWKGRRWWRFGQTIGTPASASY